MIEKNIENAGNTENIEFIERPKGIEIKKGEKVILEVGCGRNPYFIKTVCIGRFEKKSCTQQKTG